MATGAIAGDRPVRRIERTRGLATFDLREFWSYRELLFFLVWRDIKIRYKQTFLGPAWAILRPLLMTVVFTLVFNRIAQIPSGNGAPYQLFSFCGVALWTYFASALNGGSTSVVGNSSLVSKIYFPRLYVTLAAVVAPLVDLVFSLVAGILLFAYYGWVPGWHALLAPLFALVAAFFALGLALWLAPVTVRYRDVPYAIPLLTQLWMFVTPVAYPLARLQQQLPSRLRWIADVNPVTAPVTGFRWAFLGGAAPSARSLAAALGLGAILIATGFVSFRRMEHRLADTL